MLILNLDKIKKILLLMGAFSFAFFIGTVVHEFGHVIAIKAFGIEQFKVIIHPFVGNYVTWDVDNNFIGYVDAAGPLFNVFMGNSFLIGFWRWRQRIIPSILLWGPVALIQEGFNSLIQVALNIPGSDSVRIIFVGVPAFCLVTIDSLFLIAGVVLLTIQLPLYGVSAEDSCLSRITTLVPGFVGFMMAIFLYDMLFNPLGVTRGIVLIIFSSAIAILVSFMDEPISKHVGIKLRCEVAPINGTVIFYVLGLATTIIILGLFLFN